MGTVAVWKTLDKMVEDLKKKGARITPGVISDLNSAKALLGERDLACIDGDALQKIDTYLLNVEANLILEAQKLFGDEYADGWLRKIGVASGKKTEETESHRTRFTTGVPRGQRWIRILPSESLSDLDLVQSVHELGLFCKSEEDGSLLVHGNEEDLRDFVKRIAAVGKSKAVKR